METIGKLKPLQNSFPDEERKPRGQPGRLSELFPLGSMVVPFWDYLIGP